MMTPWLLTRAQPSAPARRRLVAGPLGLDPVLSSLCPALAPLPRRQLAPDGLAGRQRVRDDCRLASDPGPTRLEDPDPRIATGSLSLGLVFLGAWFAIRSAAGRTAPAAARPARAERLAPSGHRPGRGEPARRGQGAPAAGPAAGARIYLAGRVALDTDRRVGRASQAGRPQRLGPGRLGDPPIGAGRPSGAVRDAISSIGSRRTGKSSRSSRRTLNLPTLLDLDPDLARSGSGDRSFPLWLLRPRTSKARR